MQRTYAVHVVGCRTNQYEAEAFKSQLQTLGFRQAQEGEVATLCIIHTCAVTEGAESSSRHAIRQFISRHPGSRVVVTGCLAKRDPASLKAIDGITTILSTEDREGIIQSLFPDEKVSSFCIDRFEGHTRAFVKIQDGCNHFCSYCTVPFLRGRSRSRTVEEIVDEVKKLICSDYKEIVLTGVNVGDFCDGQRTLADLIVVLGALPGLHRLRLSSINPNEMDERLLEAMLTTKSFCPSTHLVAQSGSNNLLQRMGRKYTKELYLEKVDYLRRHVPDWMFSTDIIVGFPGETEDDVKETLDLIEQARFMKVHLFPYSKRPNTRAAYLGDEISAELIKERKRRITEAADRIAFSVRDSYRGRRVEVLVETGIEGERLVSQTANGLSVLVPARSVHPNHLVMVRVQTNSQEALLGDVEL